MNIKAIVFDLDGTLLGTDDKIREESIKAVIEAKAKGIKVIICTGRPLLDTLTPLKDIEENPFDFAILNNGAYEYNFSNKEIIVNGEVDKELLNIFSSLGKKYETLFAIHLLGNQMRGNFFKKTPPEWYIEVKKEEIYFEKEESKFISIEEAIQKIGEQKITQLSYRSTVADAQKMHKELISLGIGNLANLFISSGMYMELCPKGINKFVGMERLMKRLNIDINEVVAFGDSGNDIEMLKNAGLGIAMGNAWGAAKEVADVIIGTNDTNAIANKIREMVK